MFRTATMEVAPNATGGACIVRLSIASEEAKVIRKDETGKMFYERLSMRPGDAKLHLLKTNGVVLQDHDDRKPIGSVRDMAVHTDKRVRGTIVVTDPAWQAKITAGGADIPVSVGYHWLGMVREDATSDYLPTRYYAWEPYEVSLLTSPAADKTVGINRSMKSSLVNQLMAYVSGGGQEFDTSKCSLRETCDFSKEPTEHTRAMLEDAPTRIGGDFVTGRLFRFEGLLPQRRDSTAGDFAAGGALVGMEMQPIVSVLKNKCAAVALGATVFTGMQGLVHIPRSTAALTPQSLAETGAVTPSDLVTDQLIATPHRVSMQIKLSKQLLIQAPGTEAFLRREFANQLATNLDRLIWWGGQNPAEPIGILNAPGVASEVFGGPPTWPAVLKFEKALADSNADIGSLGWALSPATRNAWKQVPRAGTFPSFIMEGDARVNGYRSAATNNLAGTDQCVFGNFEELIILVWSDGMELINDPVTQASKGEVVLTCNLWCDFVIPHIRSFCVSADSAAA